MDDSTRTERARREAIDALYWRAVEVAAVVLVALVALDMAGWLA